jgi:hypothetical protein
MSENSSSLRIEPSPTVERWQCIVKLALGERGFCEYPPYECRNIDLSLTVMTCWRVTASEVSVGETQMRESDRLLMYVPCSVSHLQVWLRTE